MSSSSNVQSYLTNVFRPVYTYDSVNGFFQPSLELSNVDNLTANTITAFTAAINDSNLNVYIGSGAGNPYNIPQNCSGNIGIGYSALNGISNVSNTIAIGVSAGQGLTNNNGNILIGTNVAQVGNLNTIIGDNAGGNSGNGNTLIGAGATATGDSNIILGSGSINLTGSNQFVLGINNTIRADLSSNLVGINQPTPAWTLDVNGYTHICNALGINASPLDHTLNLNGDFYASDGYGTLSFGSNVLNISGLIVGRNGYTTIAGSTFIAAGDSQAICDYRPGVFDLNAYGSINGDQLTIYKNVISPDGTTGLLNLSVYTQDGAFINDDVTKKIFLVNGGGADYTFVWNVTYSPLGIVA